MSAISPLYTAAKALSVATAMTVIFAGSAYALDGNDVAKRLQSRFAEQGVILTFGNVETDGSTVTLRDTTVGMKTVDIEDTKIGDVVLTDVAEDADGTYTADKASFNDVEKTEDKTVFTLKGIEIGKIRLASDKETDPIAKMMYYGNMKADTLTVSENGVQMVSMKDLYANSSDYVKGGSINVDFGIKTIDLDIAKMDEMRMADTSAEESEPSANPLLDLGYKTLNISLSSLAEWNPEKGDFSIDKLEFDVKDVGSLNLTMKFGGYDLKFIETVQETSKQLTENAENSDAANLAMLGLVQQLTLGAASINYVDASLTPKLLEYYAKQQGISSADMVNQIKGIAPLMVGYLGNADFAMQAVTAINTYFDDPKSLTIAAAPEAPVSFALIGATGMAEPQKLLDLLKVSIKANQ